MTKKIKNKNLVKTKFINRIMSNGNKTTCENLLIKSFKNLQANSKKQSKKIFQLSILNFMPLFRLNEISNKKLKKKQRKIKIIPSFVANTDKRISLSIKYIIKELTKNEIKNPFDKKLYQKLLTIAINKKSFFEHKPETIEKILANKRYLKSYRW